MELDSMSRCLTREDHLRNQGFRVEASPEDYVEACEEDARITDRSEKVRGFALCEIHMVVRYHKQLGTSPEDYVEACEEDARITDR
jgi:hypothetical protein